MNTCCTHLFREAKREIEIRDKRIIELQSECAQFRDEIAKSKQGPMNNVDKEAFDKYVKENQSIYFGVPSWEINTDRTVWLAACEYKQKYINELESENAKLNLEIEKFKGYLEAWRIDE